MLHKVKHRGGSLLRQHGGGRDNSSYFLRRNYTQAAIAPSLSKRDPKGAFATQTQECSAELACCPLNGGFFIFARW